MAWWFGDRNRYTFGTEKARTNDIVNEHGFNFNIDGTSSGGPTGTVPYFAQQNNGGNWTFCNLHGPELDVYADPIRILSNTSMPI